MANEVAHFSHVIINAPQITSYCHELNVQEKGLKVPDGVKVHGIYLLFGRYDVAVPYEAPDSETAVKYITADLAPVAEVERNLAVPIPEAFK